MLIAIHEKKSFTIINLSQLIKYNFFLTYLFYGHFNIYLLYYD